MLFRSLDTLSTKLYQVNASVGRIAQRQATMGGFAPEASLPPPPPVPSESEDDDDDYDGDDDDASDDDDGALPMRCLLNTLTLCHL